MALNTYLDRDRLYRDYIDYNCLYYVLGLPCPKWPLLSNRSGFHGDLVSPFISSTLIRWKDPFFYYPKHYPPSEPNYATTELPAGDEDNGCFSNIIGTAHRMRSSRLGSDFGSLVQLRYAILKMQMAWHIAVYISNSQRVMSFESVPLSRSRFDGRWLYNGK